MNLEAFLTTFLEVHTKKQALFLRTTHWILVILGKPYNADTELYDYGLRDYSPKIARFTSIDPIRDGRNWFCYVVNDPVNFVDLWGLQCKSESDRENTRDRIHQAILKNLNFVSNDKMACDVFITKVLEDSNEKPSNWPDPEWTSVLEYKEKYNDSLIDEPSNGWNIVFMYSENLTMEINGSQVETDPTPHTGLLKQNNNGSIILFHYTQGKVKIQQFSDTEDFLNRMPKEIYYYDKAKFQSLE